MKKSDAYGWREILGIMIVMLQEKLPPVLHSKKTLVVLYLAVALGISVLAAGVFTYLSTYGSDTVALASISNDAAISGDIVPSTPTPTQVPTPMPTPVIVLQDAPTGPWSDEACTAAGQQMNAQMASFWTSPQGVGCNLLIDGAWITLQ